MIKALKVSMIVYGVIGILFGLAYIFVPRQLGAMFGHEQGPEYVAALCASLGACFIAVSVFLIAAARDPLLHIYWVKFAILFAILEAVVEIYSVIMGHLDLGQAATAIVLHAVFAVALLAFYPWRAASHTD
jgi:hypothetical protein